MNKKEYRVVIRHFYMKEWTASQIKAELDSVHGKSAPALKTIYFWINEFKAGRTSTKDTSRGGRPKEITTVDMIERIYGIVMLDRSIKIKEIAKTVGISAERVHNILHKKLHMEKNADRWEQCSTETPD